MNPVSQLEAKIQEAFPGARSLLSDPDVGLDHLWVELPLFESDGVRRLLPCLMLTVLEASRSSVTIPSGADQVLIFLDGRQKHLPLSHRTTESKVKTAATFSRPQVEAVRAWLDFVRGLSFTEPVISSLRSAKKFWKQQAERRH